MNTDPVKALKRLLLKEYGKAISAGNYPLVIRVQADCPDNYEPLSWLASQKEYPKFFWRSEDGGRVLAYAGAAYIFTCSDRSRTVDQWDILRHWQERVPSLRGWCGGSFHQRLTGSEWSDFDAWSMVIPRIGLERDPVSAKWHLICQLILSEQDSGTLDEAIAFLDKMTYREDMSAFTPDILSRNEWPIYDVWLANVEKMLAAIKAGEISKIVLARCLELTLSRAMPPEAVMARLLQQSGHGFMCLPAPMTAFLGVSPELLYHRRRDRLDTFAVAGTRPRGQNEIDDKRFKEELAASSKDRLEHQQVVDMLADRLRQLCVLTKLDAKRSMVELANQRHLFQRLRGRLLDGVNDEMIINTLHPTPAVGGVPTDQAIKILGEIEPFDRGWFAGTIGWISRDEAQMAVGIRSCLIRQDQWYIYGGAGVVQGSNPLSEWEEIGLKMKNILDVLYVR